MNQTEAYFKVREILEARPEESLHDAAQRAKKEARSGRWAAVRILRVCNKPSWIQWPEIEAIAERGMYR